MRLMVLLFLLGACATSPVAAQIRPGDFVVGSNSPSYPGLGVVDAVTGRITRFVTTHYLVSHLTLAPTNDAVIAAADDVPCTLDDPLLYAFDPGTGSLTTYARVTVHDSICGNGGLFVDQDGSLIYAHQESHRTGIWRFQKGSGARLTLIDWVVRAMTRDADTGDWIFDAELNQQGALLRFSGNRITTIGAGGRAYGILHDQATGHFWSIHYTGILLRDRSTGLTLRTVNPPGFGATFAAIDDVTGEFYTITGYYNYIARIAANGSVLRVWGPFTNVRLSGLVIWGTRTIAGSGSVTPGSTCNVTLSFPRSPRAPYAAAVSLAGLRPGPKLPYGALHIAPDALFWTTLGRDIPGLTHGFSGLLDHRGRGALWFRVPEAVPRGTVFTLAAAAINPARPLALDWGRSWTVAVQ